MMRKAYAVRLMAKSPPSRGAWIEIAVYPACLINYDKSPPSRGAWIEMQVVTVDLSELPGSPPSRGAWIEM